MININQQTAFFSCNFSIFKSFNKSVFQQNSNLEDANNTKKSIYVHILAPPVAEILKLKKHIAQLKDELVTISRWRHDNNTSNTIFDLFDTWKQKGRHALYRINNHTEDLKKSKRKPSNNNHTYRQCCSSKWLLTRKIK